MQHVECDGVMWRRLLNGAEAAVRAARHVLYLAPRCVLIGVSGMSMCHEEKKPCLTKLRPFVTVEFSGMRAAGEV
jgi:hypothetical protein